MNSYLNKFFRRFFLFKRSRLKRNYNRVLPLNELISDRWEKAAYLGFGKGASIYDTSCVYGDVKVGEHTWVGPFTVLDGTGKLTIGNNCSISAGVHIYTHSTVMWAVTGGEEKYEYEPVTIGDNCFIGPQVIIQKGVQIGKQCIIAANSFVNGSFPDNTISAGNPAKIIGEVLVENGKTSLKYFNGQ